MKALPHAAPPAPPAPVPVQPVAEPVSHVTASQYHAQDELGGYGYGYSNPNSAKQESRDANGVVRGAYSYVDANGIPRRVAYVADAYGFRLVPEATNALPADTPEVAGARLAHFDALRHAAAQSGN